MVYHDSIPLKNINIKLITNESKHRIHYNLEQDYYSTKTNVKIGEAYRIEFPWFCTDTNKLTIFKKNIKIDTLTTTLKGIHFLISKHSTLIIILLE